MPASLKELPSSLQGFLRRPPGYAGQDGGHGRRAGPPRRAVMDKCSSSRCVPSTPRQGGRIDVEVQARGCGHRADGTSSISQSRPGSSVPPTSGAFRSVILKRAHVILSIAKNLTPAPTRSFSRRRGIRMTVSFPCKRRSPSPSSPHPPSRDRHTPGASPAEPWDSSEPWTLDLGDPAWQAYSEPSALLVFSM